jgi:putative endonuclease
MKGYMYILECADGSFYTGSIIDLERRINEHKRGEGANYTSKRLPVRLLYFEEFNRIDKAFYREKQVQGWGRAKKKALIGNRPDLLHELARCRNETASFDSAQEAGDTGFDSAQEAETGRSLSEAETSDTEELKYNSRK